MSYLNINIPKASSLPICFRRLTNLYIKVIRNSQIFCNDSQLLICKAISLRYFICGVVPFADVGASGINYSICIVPCSILKLFIEHCIVLNTILIARLTRMPVCIRCAGCNGVQREHNKKLNNGLPILHKVPPKRDYGRYFCIMAEKGGTSHGGLTEKLSPFFHAKKQEVNAYGR